jgi:hypothetical protein
MSYPIILIRAATIWFSPSELRSRLAELEPISLGRTGASTILDERKGVVGRHYTQDHVDSDEQTFEGSLGYRADQAFHFGDRHFDRIEVGTVRQQAKHRAAGGFDPAVDVQ